MFTVCFRFLWSLMTNTGMIYSNRAKFSICLLVNIAVPTIPISCPYEFKALLHRLEMDIQL